VTRQRLRWEGGRFHIIRTWLPQIIAAAITRRDGCLLDAALDLATPPLGMLTIAAAGGALVTGIAVVYGGVPAWAVAPWLVGLLAMPAFVVVGLRAAHASPGMWHAVWLGAPRYLAWKVITYIRLLHRFDAARWERSDRLNAQPRPRADRVDVGGVPVDVLDMSGALLRIQAAMNEPRLFQVSTINLDFVVKAQSDPEVRRIFRRSDLNLADGAPVVWLGRLLGANMPARVAGADLVPALLREAARGRARLFLLGGEGGVARAAGEKVIELFPGLEVVGTYEPARAAVQDMDNAEILARIDAARPDILLVAFGHPKQELWIDMHRDRLPVSVAIGVGCVFDLIAGRVNRAPGWMQDAGLEWLYRVAQEPRRLTGRYFKDAAWLVLFTGRAVRARLAAPAHVESA
jgi:exopolysaccharide biosynthesis WecB/TagA/CpsF family protein